MYLSKLEIYGFKSFTQKACFRFNGGITAIVGPNGCGKSNIVDAIRWVLGEQKTSVLRLEQMENVIFNGSAKRKPLSMAEVTLTIENTKKILPSEYSEVQIGRRLFRNGDSQYFLNKVKCRLRDIVDLFMDTGMGADSYSVIELKMVESILSGRIEERRNLLEEAAGINKYRTRLKEASSKLDSVQQDLLRLMDIKIELEKSVASLGRQASKTRRYNKLIEELRNIELQCINYDYINYIIKYQKIDEISSSYKNELINLENSYNELLDEHKELLQQKNNIEKELKSAREQEDTISERYHNLIKEIAVSEEKLKNLMNRKETLNVHIIEGEKQKEVSKLTLIYQENEYERVIKELDELKESLDFHKDELKKDNLNINALRIRTSEYFNQLTVTKNQAKYFEGEIEKIQNRKQLLAEKLEKLKSNLQSLDNEIEEIKIALQNEQDIQRIFEQDIETKIEELESNQNQRQHLINEIERLKESYSQLMLNLENLQTQYGFLTGMNLFIEPVKYLKNIDEWNIGEDKVTFGEQIGIDEDLRIAYSVALGEFANYFIVEDVASAGNAILLLKRDEKGRAGFIPLKYISANSIPPEALEGKEIIGWASEIPRADKSIRDVLRAVLGKTLIIKNTDFEQVSKYILDGLADYVIMQDGTAITKDGFISGGANQADNSSIIALKERITRINEQIESINKEKDKIELEICNNKGLHDNIDISNLRNELSQAEKSLSQCKNKMSELNFQLKSKEENKKYLKENIARIHEEIEEIKNNNTDYTENLENAIDAINNLQSSYELFSFDLEELEANIKEKEELFEKLENSFFDLNTEQSALKNEKNSIQKSLERLDGQKYQLLNELENIAIQLSEIEVKNQELTKGIENQHISQNEVKNVIDVLSNRLNTVNSRIELSNNETLELNRQLDSAKLKIHQQELLLTELSSQIKNLENKASELYSIELNENQIFDSDFAIEDAKSTIKLLKEKLSVLGNVNFLAIEEYEKENERLNFLSEQIKDLTESENTLNETIDEINRTAIERFLTTFETIRKNFAKLFKILFGENGVGDIQLIGDNPLESDIEIISIPPGKKPHSIEQISTGEKTLTAIALLFAIYLVKPSPFCILDEVDAPLDDANIDKFINLIKEFSQETQFIIVTHNKRTMESANTLFGITMSEEGVSNVVSVRLENEQAMQ